MCVFGSKQYNWKISWVLTICEGKEVVVLQIITEVLTIICSCRLRSTTFIFHFNSFLWVFNSILDVIIQFKISFITYNLFVSPLVQGWFQQTDCLSKLPSLQTASVTVLNNNKQKKKNLHLDVILRLCNYLYLYCVVIFQQFTIQKFILGIKVSILVRKFRYRWHHNIDPASCIHIIFSLKYM